MTPDQVPQDQRWTARQLFEHYLAWADLCPTAPLSYADFMDRLRPRDSREYWHDLDMRSKAEVCETKVTLNRSEPLVCADSCFARPQW
jgi:hypothetical protein